MPQSSFQAAARASAFTKIARDGTPLGHTSRAVGSDAGGEPRGCGQPWGPLDELCAPSRQCVHDVATGYSVALLPINVMLYSAMLALVGADDEQTSKELAHMRKALPYVHAGITQETPTHGF